MSNPSHDRAFSWAVVFACLAFLSGCAGKIPPLSVTPPPQISTEKITVHCGIDTTAQWTYTEYQVPGKISDAEVDLTGERLAVKYSNNVGKKISKTAEILTIALSQDAIEKSFQVPINTTLLNVADRNMALQEGLKLLIVNLDSGKITLELPSSYTRLAKDNTVLTNPKGKLELWDLARSTKSWERPWSGGDAPLVNYYRAGNGIFVINDGLWYADLNTGEGWYFETKTWHKNIAKQVAAEVALGILSVLTGTYNTAQTHPDIIWGLHSNPMVIGDHVIFASEDYLTCLSLEKGEIIWQKKHDKDAGTQCLFQLDSLGILADYGTKILNGEQKYTERPYISAFDLQSGEEKWHLVPEPLMSFDELYAWRGYVLATTKDSFYIIDKKGKTLQPQLASGFKPQKMFAKDDVLLLGGGENIYVWDDSLKELWQKNVSDYRPLTYEGGLSEGEILQRNLYWFDSMPNAISKDWLAQDCASNSSSRFATNNDIFWAVENDHSLTAYDAHKGTRKSDISFGTAEIWFRSNHLLLVQDNRIGVLPISSFLAGCGQ
jgi:hypothetical protein